MEKKGEISILTIAVAAILVISSGVVLVDRLSGGYITGLFIGIQADSDIFPYGADFGDVPDSTNHNGSTASYQTTQVRKDMTAYPIGGPPGVIAEFPTTYFPAANGSSGPCHHNDIPFVSTHCVNLGRNISYEYRDADLLPDDDEVEGNDIPNINVTADAPDQDFYDDGLIYDVTDIGINQLAMENCTNYSITFNVTLTCTVIWNYTLNVWIDWNRDGDWNDTLIGVCNGTDVDEWAVQDYIIPLTSYGTGTWQFTTPNFLTYEPKGEAFWTRMTLDPGNKSDMNANGSGPGYCFTDGETEDYYIQLCQDNDGDGFAGNTFLNCGAIDCDDNDADIYPGAKEICDGKDNDCDGLTDEVIHEPCDDMISYWRLDDPRRGVDRIFQSSICARIYSGPTEVIGRPAIETGIFEQDLDCWERQPFSSSPFYGSLCDKEPPLNIYHSGGEICYEAHNLEGGITQVGFPGIFLFPNGIPPPIRVYGPLNSSKVTPNYDTPTELLSLGECLNFNAGYYAVKDTLRNFLNVPVQLDCSNPPYGRPQYTISYVDTSIRDETALDYVNGNNGDLIAGSIGEENCSWPGCWTRVSLYCPPFSIFPDCSCPPSELPFHIYSYDPLEVPEVSCNPDWGNCPVVVCAPCPPDCVTAGNTLPPQWTEGRDSGSDNASCGFALEFEGDGDYMEANDLISIPAANESQTIGIWYKLENDSAVLGSSAYRTLITLYNATNQSAVSIVINQNDLGVRKYNGTFLVKTSSLPSVDSWIFVAYTYDQDTGIHRLYIDGTEADNSTIAPDTAVPETMRIGKSRTETTVSFDGAIDDVAIWDRALEPYDIVGRYNNICTYCGTDQLCHEATMILWDETDERNLPYVDPPRFPGQQVKSFTNYTLTYPD